MGRTFGTAERHYACSNKILFVTVGNLGFRFDGWFLDIVVLTQGGAAKTERANDMNPETVEKVLKITPSIATTLHDLSKESVRDRKGTAYPIGYFVNRRVRYVDLGRFRFMTQNPIKPSLWGRMAREGHKITWVIHQPTNAWIARVVNGKLVRL
jgi:hypothetical protein